MKYCISDIHGCYKEFMEILEQIKLTDLDDLYILGDVIDRGDDSIACLQYIKAQPNMHLLMGNHELMMIESIIHDIGTSNWRHRNGGNRTLQELRYLPEDEQASLLDYVKNLPHHFEVTVNNQHYVLTHAGLRLNDDMRNPDITLTDILAAQDIEDMLWLRRDFYKYQGIPGKTIIFGHTRVSELHATDYDDELCYTIWKDPIYMDKICIDCACVNGGNLVAIRLDDMKEFFVKSKQISDHLN